MKKFRIKVDLSFFFGDERKLAHILVDPAWESVKSLQQRVEQIFEVDNVRFITNEGCFVPPQEPIQVIRKNDILRAFIPSGDKKKKRKNDISNNEVSVNDEEKVKKRKRELVSKETGLTSSTPNNAKRSKSVVPFSAAIKNSTVDEITSTSEQLGLKYEKQKTNTEGGTNVKELEIPPTVVNDESCQKMSPAFLPERSEVTKKRRRKKKNKNNQLLKLTQNNETMNESENLILDTNDAATTKPMNCNTLRSCSGVPASTLRNESKQKSIQSGHSYFDDTGETVSTTTENEANEMPTKIIFQCPVSEVSYDKPRVFSLKKTVPDSLETEKTQANSETKEAQSDVVLEPERIKSRSPLIIQELLIIPNVVPSIENKTNEDSSNVNEIVCIQMEKSMANNAEQKEQETTTVNDDSSVIAIESENDDESEEENDKNGSDEQDEDVSEIIDLNASDDESQQSTIIVNGENQTADDPGEKMSIDEMIPFSTALEALPVPDEIIIFKLYRLDGKRSGFIAGKCQYINKRTKSLKLFVIDGQKEISGIPNKYICSFDDSTAAEKQYLQVKYNDLLDAKLFSRN